MPLLTYPITFTLREVIFVRVSTDHGFNTRREIRLHRLVRQVHACSRAAAWQELLSSPTCRKILNDSHLQSVQVEAPIALQVRPNRAQKRKRKRKRKGERCAGR